jgi:hypothetical protein
MKHEPNRLSFRIPWVAEVAAEGPLALAALLFLFLIAVSAKWLGIF